MRWQSPEIDVTWLVVFLVQVDAEGIWKVVSLATSTLTRKPYDVLDHRKPEFDIDYEDFKSKMEEQHVRHYVLGLIKAKATNFL